jgi:protein-S-isoprenylcysteine O-methyltransferase Ste14
MASQHKGSSGPIRRGVYRFNLLGTATFIGLRSLDIFIQYQILAHGWGTAFLHKLGLSTLPFSDIHSFTDLPLPRKILLAMAAGSTLKHIIWLLFISKEEMIPKTAVGVSIYNSLINSFNSLLFVTTASSGALYGPSVQIPGTRQTVSLPVAIGTVLYVIGIVTETVSEIQRKRFKDDPANKGKICTVGLWGWARHINYGAYALWRTAYSLAAGGWPAAALMGAWQAWSFAKLSVPELEEYMRTRYGEQWKKYKADVPHMLFPGIY